MEKIIFDFEYPKSRRKIRKDAIEKRKQWQTNFWWTETRKSRFITQIVNKKWIIWLIGDGNKQEEGTNVVFTTSKLTIWIKFKIVITS